MTGRKSFVFCARLSFFHFTGNADNIFWFKLMLFFDYNLGLSVSISKVNKGKFSVISDCVNPAIEFYILSYFFFCQLSTGVRSHVLVRCFRFLKLGVRFLKCEVS